MSTNPSTPSPRVFRGRSTAELIPTIQAELGAEAIVVARRSGLEGGIGGFFQRPFVEIEAQPGGPRVDLYDGGVATPPAAATAPTTAGRADFAANEISLADLAPSAVAPSAVAPSAVAPSALDDAFADVLAAASTRQLAASYNQLAGRPTAQFEAQLETRSTTRLEPRGGTELDREPEAGAPAEQEIGELEAIVASRGERRPRRSAGASKVAGAVAAELQAVGFEAHFAGELIEEAGAHVIPFAPRIGLRRAVRIALERKIPVATPLRGGGAALALVGPGGSGKTKCAAALATGYRRAGALAVGCASISTDTGGDGLRMVFSPRVTTPAQAHSQRALKAIAAGRAGGVVLLDTPAVSPAQGAEVKQLGRVLAQIGPDRTLAMLPATLGARAAGQLLAALAPLRASGLAITHADETDQLGVAVQAACSFGVAPEYVLTGAAGARAIERTDPAALAVRLIP